MTALSFRAVSTVDYHTGGEPFRIVAAPPVDLPGATVADRRVRAVGDPQAAADGATEVRIDVPSGRVVARVHTQAAGSAPSTSSAWPATCWPKISRLRPPVARCG